MSNHKRQLRTALVVGGQTITVILVGFLIGAAIGVSVWIPIVVLGLIVFTVIGTRARLRP